jgi:hypothetical protein
MLEAKRAFLKRSGDRMVSIGKVTYLLAGKSLANVSLYAFYSTFLKKFPTWAILGLS